jgi:putative nucleotidyltransferase with HDIG domain
MLLMPTIKKHLEQRSSIGRLPTLRGVLENVQKYTADPKMTIWEISEHISKDPSLSVHLLRMANSAYYARAEPVVSIQEAVLFLGVEQVRMVSMSTNCVELMSPEDKCGFLWADFWRHCIATAYFSRMLGKFFSRPNVDPELDYIAGLLHDVGKLVIGMLFPDGFGHVVMKAREEKLSFCDAEKNFFDTDHAALGGWYLERQGVPSVVFEAVRCHHNWNLSVENKEVGALVNVADFLSRSSGLGCSGNMEEIQGTYLDTPAWKFLYENWRLKEDFAVLNERIQQESSRLGGLVESLIPKKQPDGMLTPVASSNGDKPAIAPPIAAPANAKDPFKDPSQV